MQYNEIYVINIYIIIYVIIIYVRTCLRDLMCFEIETCLVQNPPSATRWFTAANMLGDAFFIAPWLGIVCRLSSYPKMSKNVPIETSRKNIRI